MQMASPRPLTPTLSRKASFAQPTATKGLGEGSLAPRLRIKVCKNGDWDFRSEIELLVSDRWEYLLDDISEKLQLDFAARRLFREDGQEITSLSDLPSRERVFVSSGEEFRTLSFIRARSGSIMSGSRPRSPSIAQSTPSTLGSPGSPLQRKLSFAPEVVKRARVLLFKNGEKEGFNGVEMLVADKFSDFLDEITLKLQLTFPARRLFTVHGDEVTTIEEAKGTLYVSGGEPFKRPGQTTLHRLMSFSRRDSRAFSLAGTLPEVMEAQKEYQEAQEVKTIFLALLKTDRGFCDQVRDILLTNQEGDAE
eukprot:TRINITY_DN15745_c0_g1_i1.p1 TRINITY_DN15745_c0_g1~~TRINITY_DN15745_c0_g1_i1.p1  ORF type:complete len:308 (-),score=38.78 TRINITY_DN15745_c0_g1_i1:111-1034(-)